MVVSIYALTGWMPAKDKWEGCPKDRFLTISCHGCSSDGKISRIPSYSLQNGRGFIFFFTGSTRGPVVTTAVLTTVWILVSRWRLRGLSTIWRWAFILGPCKDYRCRASIHIIHALLKKDLSTSFRKNSAIGTTNVVLDKTDLTICFTFGSYCMWGANWIFSKMPHRLRWETSVRACSRILNIAEMSPYSNLNKSPN